MRIDFFGPNYNFFQNAFFGTSGLDVVLQGVPTSTMAVIRQPETGVVTTLTGSGFTLDALGNVTGGTVTGMSFSQGGVTLADMSNMSWNAVGLFSALAAADVGNEAPLAALLNSGPVTLDASAATVPLVDTRDLFSFTVDTTIIGSDFGDTLAGGSGNDMIYFGNVGSDYARDSAVNDTYVFTEAVDAYSRIVYNRTVGGINATIDGDANFGRIVKANGVDTLIDIVNPLKAGWATGGFQLGGSDKDDIFTIDGGADTWMSIRGQEGNDVFNLKMSGWIRLNFNWNGYNAATQALNVNVATGVVSNDGFGFQDRLKVTSGAGVLQFETTAFADTIVGSSNKEDFILQLGDDTVDGGGGRDRVRYDKYNVEQVTVDFVTGIATGTVGGIGFTHKITNVTNIRGSYSGDDLLKGDAANNWFTGRGGDDTLIGRNGEDELEGESGNDLLRGGNGNDELWDGSGNDRVFGGNGNDIFYNGGGSDTFDGGKGRDTLVDESANWAATPATVEMNMFKGVHGTLGSTTGQDKSIGIENYTFIGDWDTKVTGNAARNVIKTDTGSDWVNGNRGNDGISTGDGNDTLLGGAGRDKLFAGNGRDVLKGGKHADVLNGGNGNDRLFGGDANDVLRGGRHNDFLNGGKGNDRLLGGAGADKFVFNGAVKEGNDKVLDFTDGVDLMRIGGGQSYADVTVTGSSTQTLVELQGGTTITLVGVDVADISVNDFEFV